MRFVLLSYPKNQELYHGEYRRPQAEGGRIGVYATPFTDHSGSRINMPLEDPRGPFFEDNLERLKNLANDLIQNHPKYDWIIAETQMVFSATVPALKVIIKNVTEKGMLP